MRYITNPKEIENKSFEIIKSNLKKLYDSEVILSIVSRVIHTTADFEYEDILEFSEDFESVLKKLESLKLFVDTNMIAVGINNKLLERAKIELYSYSRATIVEKSSESKGITKAIIAIDLFSQEEGRKAFVIGNSPTALFRLCEKIEEGLRPEFVIGVPVGFVGAEESKILLKETCKKYNIDFVITNGKKGGSTVAVAIMNALLYGKFRDF